MSVTTGTFPGIRIVDMPDLGAVTAASSFVGERAGSGRFSAAALSDYVIPWTSVRTHGARGDGIANDTAAITAAANAMPATGGVLFFPPGNYNVSGSTALKNNTYVFGPGATVIGLPAASWPGGNLMECFLSSGVSNITIDALTFSWPRGLANFGSAGTAHIIEFRNSTRIEVLNCVANGGGDMVALLGCIDTLIAGCRATNFSNAAYDHWAGAKDARVIGNYAYSDPLETHVGMGAINFTGLNTDLTPAVTSGFLCSDNFVYINNPGASGINLNGHETGGEVSKGIIANNKIVAATTVGAWGILVNGMASNVSVHHNYLEGSNSFSAVAALAPARSIQIEHNTAAGWNSVAGYGIFSNTSVGRTLMFNRAIDCNQPVWVSSGADVTTMLAGNDNGSGTISIENLALTNLVNAASDAAAAAAGVPVGLLYRNGSVIQMRIV